VNPLKPLRTARHKVIRRAGMGDVGRKLASGATSIFFQKLYLILATIGVQVILSRTMGIQKYGVYAFALAWIQLLAIPAVFGVDRIATRHVAAELVLNPDLAPRRFLRWSFRIVLLSSAVMGLFALIAGFSMNLWVKEYVPSMTHALWAGIPLIFAFALLRLQQGTLLGQDKAGKSQAGEMVVMPTLFLLFAGAAAYFMPDSFSAVTVLLIQAGAGFISALFIYIQSSKSLPKEIGVSETFRPKEHVQSGKNFVIMSIVRSANTRVDILIVGAMLGAGLTGIYSVANRGAGMMLQAQLSISLSLSPSIVHFNTKRDWGRIQRLIRKSAYINSFVSIGMAAALVLFGKYFLLLFGEEFVVGYKPLLILALGQFLVALFGPGQVLLVMTGHERDSAIVHTIGLIALVLLNVLLIPSFGMMGAAWATSIAQVATAALLLSRCIRRTGISPGILGPSWGPKSGE